jgi:hypothetical protein
MGIQSHLNIPIHMTVLDYIVSSMRCARARVWYIPRLRLLGEIFVNALSAGVPG